MELNGESIVLPHIVVENLMPPKINSINSLVLKTFSECISEYSRVRNNPMSSTGLPVVPQMPILFTYTYKVLSLPTEMISLNENIASVCVYYICRCSVW